MGPDDGHLLRQDPKLGFIVVRFNRSSITPISPNTPASVHHIGTYHTFANAQATALRLFQLALNDFYRRGQSGRYFNRIDLEQSGSIMIYQQRPSNGYMATRELVVSEFRVVLVNMSDNFWEVEARLIREKFTLVNPHGGFMDNTPVPESKMPTVRLPRKPDQRDNPVTPSHDTMQEEHITLPELAQPSSQFPPLGPQYDQETQPDWTRTRTPLFDRRADPPFRGPGHRPYAQTMVFSPPPPTLPGLFGAQDSGGIWSEATRAAV
ncbi:uncharacterized protein J4E88_006010 [Alternaria novae-zelandiae]|uniref:uncharacterized protein n=1 Tax=Alternaria viburni TaxID=566460 RepID=UPI0020C2F967|nr:uncharacterized protein J4E79_002769 [Alternaria viburni]XP_049236915.1 uncharacterized protein J4E87_001905 [Alternaria ethzedia]XP_049254654.1 uncharacterized protein J4E88_006010 [Alternaria novae-zelandiae]XP_051325297.1 uncharacterized protein J4E85_006852 [Alternaria conjuncta]XP_051355173.1 uncharacterized protein J4E92_003483 [Alternaria infectoria]KAI4625625.1 hypothetical protein J4E80_002757 [Alternaria sp. BMP 0032]KAI4702189.1 hypothetical protein J4E81_002551 [Alternaria sp. 